MRTITEVEDLKASFDGTLVLFAWAGWSPPCHQSWTTVLAAVDSLTRDGVTDDVDLALVDVTEQAGGVWETLAELLRERPGINALAYMFSGAGPVAWIRNGQVIDWTPNAGRAGAKAIIDSTRSLSHHTTSGRSSRESARRRPCRG